MACSQLLLLHLDIFILVMDRLRARELVNLGSTCHSIFAIVAPHLYKCLVVSDNPRISSSARRAAVKYGPLVRTLRLNIQFRGCSDPICSLCPQQDAIQPRDEVWAIANPGGGLPPVTKELLEGREELLPRLERIEIIFPHENEHIAVYQGSAWHDRDPAPSLLRENMRIVTRATIKALVRNKIITQLKMANYPPFGPLDFDDTDRMAWETFLGRMKIFDLSVLGEGKDVGQRCLQLGIDSVVSARLNPVTRRISAPAQGGSRVPNSER